MPRPIKSPTEELSRDESVLVLTWLVEVKKKPPPKGGRLHLLHRTAKDIAKEYGVTEMEILTASKRKLAEPG